MRARSLLFVFLMGCARPGASPAVASTPRSVAPRTLSPADIAARALPAVVTIRTEQSLGTGFVVRPDGWIATNLHVVASGGAKVRVRLRDDRELEVVELLAASPEHDLALVRVVARGLPTVPLGDSDSMRPGDSVVAIGNPLGLEDTVSNGLVSARRKVSDGFEVLQISAPIAPGSSGGPIFNDRGEVIGIATAVLQGGQNINFGVPARYLVPMIDQPSPMPFTEFQTLIAQLRHARAAKDRASTRAAGTDAGAGGYERKIAHLPTAALDGCATEAQKLIVQMLGSAIEAGAPLYNAGKPDACYHVYDGASSDLLRRLPAACRGPAKAIGDAQKRAASLTDASAQAWAMRDAFDAVLDVIARKQDQ
jgi:hypothetical protein